MSPEKSKKINKSSFFKPTTKKLIKEDISDLKRMSEELEKELEEEIKPMYIQDFFKLYRFILKE